jgi:hypothetical protein
VTGQFDPTRHRAVWPSTGNYCRGGVAISRIVGCHGVAILPAGMSDERFQWLERWVAEPGDIIRTPGTESNVREIYDACDALAKDPLCVSYIYDMVGDDRQIYRHRKNLTFRPDAVSVEVDAGDKHIPLIHNVMNTDFVVAISDRSTDSLNALFNTNEGKRYLDGPRDVPAQVVQQLPHMGFSSICNILGAIKVAKYMDMGPDDVIVTVATDGAEMYATELEKCMARDFPKGFDAVNAGEVFGEHMLGTGTDNLLELSHQDRRRIFDLGYYTWVEQQGVTLDDFVARRDQKFWRDLQSYLPAWDAMIDEFNARTGVGA